jgi:hypothetical protein
MITSKTLLSAFGYIAIVFPLAFVWHLVLFPERYENFGYFSGEPNILIGFASIIIQGFVLAIIYPLFHTKQIGLSRAFQFAGFIGLFFWTSHVLALVAKQNVPNAGAFIVMETVYLVLQFGLFALLLGVIYRSDE